MIHLETSFLVDFLRETTRRRPGKATAFLARAEQQELCVSVHVLCELHAGAANAQDPNAEAEHLEVLCGGLHIVYPDERFAPAYGRLQAWLTRQGQRISTMDLLIATSAIVAQAPLVTGNLREFSRVPALEVLSY